MANIVRMPKLGLTAKKGKISSWLKNEGDYVEQGEPLLEVMTEKVNVNVEAPYSGVLHKILCEKGKTLPITVPIAVMAEDGDDEASLENAINEALAELQAAQEQKEKGGEEKRKESKPVKPFTVFSRERKISPRAAKLARQEGVDPALIPGTGPNGRVVEKDVRDYLDQAGDSESQVLPIDGMRAVIAERMSSSRKQAAHVTVMEEVDVTALQDARSQLNNMDETGKVKFSYTDLLVKFAAQALEEYPMVNSRSTEEEIELPAGINIGVAVALESGLVVPNVKNVQNLSLDQLSAKIKDVTSRARENELNPDEVEGGTFTITNLGMFGAEGFTPIINRPETAILGVGTMRTKPAVINGQLEKRTYMTLSLSLDHRVIDGGPATEFLSRLKEMLEEPHPWLQLDYKKPQDNILSSGGRTPHQLRNAYRGGIDKLMETAPDVVMGFSSLTEGIFFEDGEVSKLHKELIAVALAVYIKCEYCIAAHIHNAMQLGATGEQVLEAANVSVFFGGGAALAHTSTIVQECIEAFGD